MQQAARAAQDPTTRDSVMSMEELERLWGASKPGSVKIFMIQARGWVETPSDAAAAKDSGSSQPSVQVAAVGVEEEAADGSLLPLEERGWAEKIVQELQK